jgi:hypothetical protein
LQDLGRCRLHLARGVQNGLQSVLGQFAQQDTSP